MLPDDVAVSWAEGRQANNELWDDRAELHEELYDAHALAADPTGVSRVVRDDLPVLLEHLHRPVPGERLRGDELAGLDLVHLQCHIGTDTISLARCGARVTGLDFSATALEVAGRLAVEAGRHVDWVRSDVKQAAAALGRDFDVVYTSIGVLCWIDDLDAWARQVHELLRPGGVLLVRDGHPMLYALDESADRLVLANRYFGNGLAQTWDDGATYAGEATTSHTRSYEWPHPVGELVGALLRAGLVLERLDEGRSLPWQFSPRMVSDGKGSWRWPGDEADRVPCTITVVARRPQVG